MENQEEFEQRHKESRLTLSKILMNIKYMNQGNALPKEVQNHHKHGKH
jgi:hypothetical protein